MSPVIKRVIISGWVILAICTVMYFVYKGDDPILKLVVIFGGFGALFFFIKGYLFKA